MGLLHTAQLTLFLLGAAGSLYTGARWAVLVPARPGEGVPTHELPVAVLVLACSWLATSILGGALASLAVGAPLTFAGYVARRIARGAFALEVSGRVVPPLWREHVRGGEVARPVPDSEPWRASLRPWKDESNGPHAGA